MTTDGYVTTEKLCDHCKEAKERPSKYLIELPIPTKKLSLKVSICPFCDQVGDNNPLLKKAYTPR
jgi:hypothetical protein